MYIYVGMQICALFFLTFLFVVHENLCVLGSAGLPKILQSDAKKFQNSFVAEANTDISVVPPLKLDLFFLS